jgi:MFS family permease
MPAPPSARVTSATHTPGTRRWWLVAIVLLALFLFQAGNMALFAFIIPLGEDFGLQLAFISRTLAWATWIGALGAVLVIVMGTRMGRVWPLVAAMVLTVAGVAALGWSHLPVLFFAANAGTAITWSFVVPLLFGMASAQDRSGRLTTVAGFMSGLGLASGPLLAGLVAHTGDFVLLIAVAVALLALSGVFAVVSARRVDRLDVLHAARGSVP